MARSDRDRKSVKVDRDRERTDRRREVDLFRDMEEDMVFGGRGRRDLRSPKSSRDDDGGRW